MIYLLATEKKIDFLYEELQLGNKLNECVHQQKKSEFSLMLAMLVDDVRLHSQFHLPKQLESVDENIDFRLRKHFQVKMPPPLALENVDDISYFNEAEIIQNKELATIRLKQALNPKALAFRDDDKHIPTQTLSNTSLYCQYKQQTGSDGVKNSVQLPFDAKEWLNGVEAARVSISA